MSVNLCEDQHRSHEDSEPGVTRTYQKDDCEPSHYAAGRG